MRPLGRWLFPGRGRTPNRITEDRLATKARKSRGRAPLTRDRLLPLPAKVARNLSLKNHLALASVRAGHASMDTTVSLLRILYMIWFMRRPALSDEGLALLIEVELALETTIEAGRRCGGWALPPESISQVERMLLLFDAVIAGTPKHRYEQAWNQLRVFIDSTEDSPIPGSHVNRSTR